MKLLVLLSVTGESRLKATGGNELLLLSAAPGIMAGA